jgi:hypothetical protein
MLLPGSSSAPEVRWMATYAMEQHVEESQPTTYSDASSLKGLIEKVKTAEWLRRRGSSSQGSPFRAGWQSYIQFT